MNIAIVGFGLEGKSNYAYYISRGDDVVIVDERDDIELPTGAKSLLGAEAFSRLGDFDLIIRSPGVAPKKLPYGDKIWSATNEFFVKCPALIIGVTGTKGKGTTSSLIVAILRAAGKNVHLVGNIGVPALEVLDKIQPDDIVVFELSSFQLWDLKKSPHIAVVLMIEPDHLDVHDDLNDYINAKANIRRYQYINDECIYHPTSDYARVIAGTELVNETWGDDYKPNFLDYAHKYAVADDNEVYVKDGFFCVQDRQICPVEHLKIPGKHNVENACAAISAITELADWPKNITDEHIVAGLEAFSGLPHRLKFVREVNGVKYFDDSIATTPGSAIAALNAFSGPRIIILGGSDKGAVYDEVIDLCKSTHSKVIAIGMTGETIAELCTEQGVPCERVEGMMEEVVTAAAKLAQRGSIVILSPASASFDQYKNYSDRGEQFITAVNALEDSE